MEVPYTSPVSTGMYPTLGSGLMLVGFIFTAVYFVYQLSSDKRSFGLELSFGAAASTALGFGALFVLLSFGLYV